MAMLETVKQAARISHNALNFEIVRLESVARSELIRAGVPAEEAKSSNELVEQAVITFILSKIGSTEKEREENKESFIYQIDNLRKHDWT